MIGDRRSRFRPHALVQGIQQAVTKAPQEKQNGDQTDGVDGLLQRELGGIGSLVVPGAQRPSLGPFLPPHDGGVLLLERLDAGGRGGGAVVLLLLLLCSAG